MFSSCMNRQHEESACVYTGSVDKFRATVHFNLGANDRLFAREHRSDDS